MTSQGELSSYWLLGDDRLRLATDPRLERSFKAHFKHSLLYNQVLVLSDSMACNNRNLRMALSNEGNIRDLITPETIRIASRLDPSGSRSPLTKLRDDFVGKGDNGFDLKLYRKSDDLSFLEKNCSFMEFDLDDIARIYQDGTSSLFNDEVKTARMPKAFRNRLRDIILEEQANGGLTRSFFYYRLGGLSSPDIWQIHRESILNLADAYYLSALPKLLDCNTICAKPHQEPMQILRPISDRKEEIGDPLIFDARLGLQSYVHALSRLTADMVFRLRSSDECAELHAARANISDSGESLRILQNAYLQYYSRIESTILQVFPEYSVESKKNNQRKITPTIPEATDHINTMISWISVAFGHPIIPMIAIIMTKPIARRTVEPLLKKIGYKNKSEMQRRDILLSAAEEQVKRDKIIEQLQKVPNNIENRVKSKGINLGQLKTETIYETSLPKPI